MEHKKEIYRKILRGERAFYGAVIVVDTIAYTVSFLVSGLVKKDIFNLLEGREGTLGITSLRLLILLNVAMPLLINCVKQVNSAMTARVRMRFDRKIKSGLLWEILSERMGEEQLRGFGESVSLFRNECEDVTEYMMEYYRQLPGIVLSMAILVVMLGINPLFALISLIPAFGITALVRSLDRWIVKFRRDARSSTGIVTEFLKMSCGIRNISGSPWGSGSWRKFLRKSAGYAPEWREGTGCWIRRSALPAGMLPASCWASSFLLPFLCICQAGFPWASLSCLNITMYFWLPFRMQSGD